MRRKKDNDYRSSPHSLQSQSSSAHSVASSNGASASSSTNLYQADLDPDQNYDIILGLCKLVDDPSPMYSGPDPEEIKRIEEQRRKERLEVNNPFRITYNNGDFNSLLDVMKQHCDINVHFLAPNLFLESFGIYPLFAFFMLISLVYPDSMVKNIEKRIATIKTSNPPPQFPLGYSMPPVEVTSETVEIIDKFTGTRVFESPIITVFNELLKLDMIMNPPPDLSVPMISQLLNSILYNGDSSSIQGSSDGKTYHIITETKLKFDLVSNKIIEWTYTIVAVSTSQMQSS